MANKKLFVVLVILILYLLPALLQFSFSETNTVKKLYLGLPITQTGDEPHYYITLYSLVNDHDFFLTNNYNNAHYNNGDDLGEKNWNEHDRHTRLFNPEKKTVTSYPFINGTYIDLDLVPDEDSMIKEIPGHALGLPIFVFIFLWPLTNTPSLEHAAIALTFFFSLVGLFAFYKIMIYYHNNENKALCYTVLFACATQYWHYSKTFWAEPYLASFLIIAWYLIIVRRTIVAHSIAGLLLGWGFLMKYPFLVTIIPFGLYIIYKKKIKEVIAFSVPLLLCFCAVLFLNYYLTNSLFQFNQVDAVSFVNPLPGVLRWLIDPTFGLITFAPVLLFGVFGVRNFWKANKAQCIVAAAVIIPYFLFWAAYVVSQYGGGGYSARYLLPLLSFIVIFISFSHAEHSSVPLFRYIFYVLFAISFIINLLAAFAYPAFTGYPLFVSLEKILFFLF